MISKEILSDIPSHCGVYQFLQDGVPIYIGKAVNCRARIASHLQNAKYNAKEKLIITSSDAVATELTKSEFAALLIEARLIKKHEPKYNVQWKDDKSYIYIKITVKEKYPKIWTVRQEDDGQSLYFGPFRSQRVTERLLRLIRRVVPFCQQKKISTRSCFYEKIGLCSPCPSTIEKRGDRRLLVRYRRNITRVVSILRGDMDDVLISLKRELEKAIQDEHFEEGLKIRNRIRVLEDYISRVSFPQDSEEEEQLDLIGAINIFLSRHFNLTKVIENPRIECFDVSTLFGRESTASMVVFEHGILRKQQYRLFKIRDVGKQSDIDMIAEVLGRRFSHQGWRRPHAVIIDGGTPQVQAAVQHLKSKKINVPVIGLAKDPDRLILGTPRKKTLRPSVNDPFFKLLQRLRDEAHRFAHAYHLKLRSKRLML